MATVDLGGTTFHYQRSGAGAGLLFVHGMCGDADVFADQAKRFDGWATCVRYDRRGHSRSARGDGAVSVGRHADDAAALIDALDLAPCLIVGSSSGAVISIDMLLRYGHLVRGAVISEPPLFSLDRDAGTAVLAELAPPIEQAMAHGGPRVAVDAFFAQICPGLWETLDDAAKERYRNNGEIGVADLRSPPLDVTTDELATVTVPTLVLAGDRSHPAFRTIAAQLAGTLPDARLVELGDCGHVTYAEQPDQFAHAVTTFADELDRRHEPAAR